jgi:tetratricopeptide (TPR) repeat protein
MNDLPRYKLREIISRYGRSVCDDPLRCEGLLRDLCGQNPLEIFALSQALRNGIPDELLTSSAQLPLGVLVSRFSKRLEDRCGMNSSLAHWAIESWAFALGLVSEDQLKPSDAPEAGSSTSAEKSTGETIKPKPEDATLPPLQVLNKKKSWFPKFTLLLLFGFLAVAVFALTKNDGIKRKASPPSTPITKGSVEIKSEPSGAKCYFDNKLIGETPRSIDDVQQGKHFVLVVKEGYQEGKQEVAVQPGGNHQLVIQLKALPPPSVLGGLSIRSEPSGADCFLNDRYLGKTPLEIADLEQKTFQLSAKKVGYRDWTEPVSVYSNTMREINFRLVPQPQSPGEASNGALLSKRIIPRFPDPPNETSLLLKAMLDGSKEDAIQKIEHAKVRLQILDNGSNCPKKKDAREKNAAGLQAASKEDTLEAVRNFYEAYILCPSDVEILNNLGFALTRAGDYDDAEKALLMALALAPARANGWANLGQVLSIKGDVSAGTACFLNAFRYSKNKDTTTEALKNLAESDPFPNTQDSARAALNRLGKTPSVQSKSSEPDKKWLVICGTFAKQDHTKVDERLSFVRDLGYEARIESTDRFPNLQPNLSVVLLGPFSKDSAQALASSLRDKLPEGAYIKAGW